MTTITVPKELNQEKNLIAVPRKEYEEFSSWRKFIGSFKTFTPTSVEKRALKKAREDYKSEKYLTINELKRKLGVKS